VKVASIVGWAVGVAALFSVFFLPFWNLTSGSADQFDTLYVALRFTVYNLGAILALNISQASFLAIVVLGAAALVAVSGTLGIFPKGAGAAGALGMLGLTVGPVFLFPGYAFSFDNFGVGFWALWVLSVANLFVGIALGGRGKPAPLPEAATMAAPAAPEVPSPAPAPSQ
jgi:hypothetical protein